MSFKKLFRAIGGEEHTLGVKVNVICIIKISAKTWKWQISDTNTPILIILVDVLRIYMALYQLMNSSEQLRAMVTLWVKVKVIWTAKFHPNILKWHNLWHQRTNFNSFSVYLMVFHDPVSTMNHSLKRIWCLNTKIRTNCNSGPGFIHFIMEENIILPHPPDLHVILHVTFNISPYGYADQLYYYFICCAYEMMFSRLRSPTCNHPIPTIGKLINQICCCRALWMMYCTTGMNNNHMSYNYMYICIGLLNQCSL